MDAVAAAALGPPAGGAAHRPPRAAAAALLSAALERPAALHRRAMHHPAMQYMQYIRDAVDRAAHSGSAALLADASSAIRSTAAWARAHPLWAAACACMAALVLLGASLELLLVPFIALPAALACALVACAGGFAGGVLYRREVHAKARAHALVGERINKAASSARHVLRYYTASPCFTPAVRAGPIRGTALLLVS